MPRIDPIQLLNCLSVLLSPNGGIKSTDEVQRLANLMNKFSKKLVSKCIYIQILKCTETELLGLFMGSGGWRLVHMWLTESIVARNWPLVKELLELLLLCPVDIERLKTNNCPKLVKELSKDENNFAISALASKLVEQWLKTVKGETVVPVRIADISQITESKLLESSQNIKTETSNVEISQKNTCLDENKETNSILPNNTSDIAIKNENVDLPPKEVDKESDILPVTETTLKDENQVVAQVEKEDKISDDFLTKEKIKVKKDKERSHSKSSKSSSSDSKHSSKSHSSSDKHKSSSSSSSRHSSKDRSREKDKRSSSSKSKSETSSRKSDEKSSSSSKSKDDKRHSTSEKNKSKDKSKEDKNDKSQENKNDKSHENKNDKSHENKNDKSQVNKIDKSQENASKPTVEKPQDKAQTPSIQKLGKIPKLSDVKKEKPSISIEVRKQDGPKPKTVKTFHSKFRKHGLEEEIKPPPSRATVLNKKPPAVVPPPTVPIPKRPSPVHNDPPPEKKPKVSEPIEKPGSIKLIPPKPKPMMLLESDMFMDALNASATTKKEPKKRKRRTSGSKDGNTTNDASSPPQTPTTVTSPSSEKSVPPRFYQDTLDTEENKEKVKIPVSPENSQDKEPEEKEIIEPHTLTVNGLKGVLCYHKRKGPKKSIKWKPDSELEEIQYFELDETERVNVTKTFTDMKYLERIHEREAFQKARNLINDDVMEEKTNWRPLILIDCEGQVHVEHGKNSKEKEIQAIRQKGTLQPLYFHKAMIPDSPLEPDTEAHPYVEPTIIPLEDVTGNQDNISDFRNMPWPEPKGNAPPSSSNMNMQTIFPPAMSQFPSGFPGAQFPGFQAPGMVPGDWQNGVPPIMPNGMPGPIPPAALPPGTMPPGNLPPGMMVPPENMIMGPEMFGAPNPMFPGPPEGFNMQQNMFPMDFNMSGPPGPEGFPSAGNFRGAMRGRGSGGHWRGKTAGNWEGPQRGRGGHSRGGRKALCIYFQRKGSCRQGDNCSFLHPGVNYPY